jgi:hypothetical protein
MQEQDKIYTQKLLGKYIQKVIINPFGGIQKEHLLREGEVGSHRKANAPYKRHLFPYKKRTGGRRGGGGGDSVNLSKRTF